MGMEEILGSEKKKMFIIFISNLSFEELDGFYSATENDWDFVNFRDLEIWVDAETIKFGKVSQNQKGKCHTSSLSLSLTHTHTQYWAWVFPSSFPLDPLDEESVIPGGMTVSSQLFPLTLESLALPLSRPSWCSPHIPGECRSCLVAQAPSSRSSLKMRTPWPRPWQGPPWALGTNKEWAYVVTEIPLHPTE